MKLSEIVEHHLDELNKLKELQNMLLEVSSDDIEQLKEYISSSSYIETKEGLRQLSYSIAIALNSRPLKYQYYLSLISFLVPQIKAFFTQDEIVDDIFGHNSIRLQLLEEGVIDFTTIYEYDRSESTFFFFGPEYKKFYPDYFNEHEIEFRNVDLKKHFLLRSEGMNESELAIIIRNDDIESFQSYVSKLNINLNSNIPKSKYEISFFLRATTSIIEYAAFYGSLKIFKFLWMNNVSVSDQLREFAVAGGNYDIVHILELKNIKFDADCLNKAIQYHHNDIVRYINDTFNIEYTPDSLRECIMSYNIEMFLENFQVIDENINCANDWGWTALHFATMHGKLDIVKLLCSVEGIDINCRNNVFIKIIFFFILEFFFFFFLMQHHFIGLQLMDTLI